MQSKRFIRFGVIFLVLLTLYFGLQLPKKTLAQAGCPDTVSKALAAVGNLCSGVQQNQACYGNVSASAVARPGATIQFSKPGDIAKLNDLQRLTLTGYNPTANTWGVAVMRVQANLPGTGGGQFVTILVMGDADIQNASTGAPMQSFYFRTGVTVSGCNQMPQDGLVVESPAGKQKVNLVANGVQLSIGSTVILRNRTLTSAQALATQTATKSAQRPVSRMMITTVRGSVTATFNGKSEEIKPGMETGIDIDEDYQPTDDLSDPRETTPEEIQAIPYDDLKILDPENYTSDSPDGTAAPFGSMLESTPEATLSSESTEEAATQEPVIKGTEEANPPEEGTPPAPTEAPNEEE